MRLSDISVETGKQIFHCTSWDLRVDEEVISDLISEAKKNDGNKARLCLHQKPEEVMQVTYLAFIAPYEDKIHCHPNRSEVLIPIYGEAESRTYHDDGLLLSSQIMRGRSGEAFASAIGTWHSLRVLTEEFVMIEVGMGPFRDDSTVLLGENKWK